MPFPSFALCGESLRLWAVSHPCARQDMALTPHGSATTGPRDRRVTDSGSGVPGRAGNRGEAQLEERGPGKELPSGAGVKLRCSLHSPSVDSRVG